MTPKERILKAIKHEEPDRVPVANTLAQEAARLLSTELNMPYHQVVRWSWNEILAALGNDAIFVGATPPADFSVPSYPDGSYSNEWGIRCKYMGGHETMIEHPLKDIETLDQMTSFFEQHGFPDPEAEGRFDLAKEQIKKFGENFAVVGRVKTTMFERSWYMVGMQKFFLDLALEEEYVFALLDKMIDFHLVIAKNLLDLGCDIILTGDDFGGQQGMLISPDTFRSVFKPRFKKVFDQLRAWNPDIIIAYHSCGMVEPIIQDFIDIDLDIFQSLQPIKGMERKKLKGKYGKNLCLWGTLDEQRLLPFGSVGEVREEVKNIIYDMAPGGGFILSAAHNIQGDTPIKNIHAIYETVEKYGEYPIGN